MLNTPLLQSLDTEKQTEEIKQWRNSIPQQTIDATLNKIRAAKFLAVEKIAGAKMESTTNLLLECGLYVGNTHLNYDGYKLFLSLMSTNISRKRKDL